VEALNKDEIANKVFDKDGEIVRKSDFVYAGLSDQDVYMLCEEGYIERIKNGFYKLASAEEPREELMLSKLMTQGIVCVESALFHYGYSDFAPREWTIAVPRAFSRTVKAIQDRVPVKAYYVQNEVYHLGETTGGFNGVILPIYDRERTICDCFKYRTKLDSEIFNKAVNAYVADERKNLANLSRYAKEMRVYSKMMNVMEVLLNA
jgi:predicted transcriptional regulator of viral defense system